MGFFDYLFGKAEIMNNSNNEKSDIKKKLYKEGRKLCAEKNYAQAYENFFKAMQLGDPRSCRMCGMMNYIGVGTKKNKRAALTLLKRAVDLDKDLESYEFVFWDEVENNINNEDYLTAKFTDEVIYKAIREQEKIRQNRIVEDKKAEARKLCETGLNFCVSGDYERALALFEEAANNNTYACEMCGMMYYIGKGTPVDQNAALTYLKRNISAGVGYGGHIIYSMAVEGILSKKEMTGYFDFMVRDIMVENHLLDIWDWNLRMLLNKLYPRLPQNYEDISEPILQYLC